MKSLRTVAGAHAVHLDQDESHFRIRLHAATHREGFRYKAVLRPCINVFYDRIFFLRIEIQWSDNDPPDIRFTITAFGHEDFRSFPSGRYQTADVGFLKFHDCGAIRRFPEHGYRRIGDG